VRLAVLFFDIDHIGEQQMTRITHPVAAALAAVLIATTLLLPTVTVPPARAATIVLA
jgi:hypothetical protein